MLALINEKHRWHGLFYDSRAICVFLVFAGHQATAIFRLHTRSVGQACRSRPAASATSNDNGPMKRHYVICCLLCLLISCRPAGPGAEPLPTVVTTVTPTALTATATLPTSVPEVARQTVALDPTASATPFTALPSPVPPTATATAAGPLPTADLGDEARLFGLYFGPAEATLSQPVFPAGTTEVFVYWTYWNLTADDVLRREWRRNGQPWLEHEESWDVTQYGSSGVRGDVSVYDFTAPGLQPGVYTLTLFLNGQFQARATFEIQAAGATGAATMSQAMSRSRAIRRMTRSCW